MVIFHSYVKLPDGTYTHIMIYCTSMDQTLQGGAPIPVANRHHGLSDL